MPQLPAELIRELPSPLPRVPDYHLLFLKRLNPSRNLLNLIRSLPTPPSRRTQTQRPPPTSPLFRALTQPLLFCSPTLPTLTSALGLLKAFEADKEGELGGGPHQSDSEQLPSRPLPSYAPALSFRNPTHLTLHELHLASHSFPASFFSSVTSLSLTTPRGSIASSPGQLADFLLALAPRLRSCELHDQAVEDDSARAGGVEIALNPLHDAFGSFTSNLTHLSTSNPPAFLLLSLLPSQARHPSK
ncbi:hypothetical protein JCM11641_002345 [Rhodosporidiobolus odoratus]